MCNHQDSKHKRIFLQQIKVYQSATIVLLVLAILVIIITFLGCCGAQNESKCLLWTVNNKYSIFFHPDSNIYLFKLLICIFLVFYIWCSPFDWCWSRSLFRFHRTPRHIEKTIYGSPEGIWSWFSFAIRENSCDSLGSISARRKENITLFQIHFFYLLCICILGIQIRNM